MRHQQKEQTRLKIIHTAKLLIESEGYEATTLRKIAMTASIATGTIFVHFKSKEELFYSAFYDDLEEIISGAFKSIEQCLTLQSQLCHIVNHFFNSFAKRPILYSSFLEHSLLAKGNWGQQFRKQVERVGMLVGKLYEEAKIRQEISNDTHTPTAVMAFFSFYYFLLIDATKHQFEGVEHYLEQFSNLLNQHLTGLQKG